MTNIFKYKSNHYIVLLLCIILGIESRFFGQENFLNLDLKNQDIEKRINFSKENNFNRTEYSHILKPEKIKEKYQETSLRRFDIIFFLSMPFFLLYQFIVHQIISSSVDINGQNKSSISEQQWLNMLFSSTIMAICVGYSDYIEIESKKKTMSSSYKNHDRIQQYKSGKIKIAFNFSF